MLALCDQARRCRTGLRPVVSKSSILSHATVRDHSVTKGQPPRRRQDLDPISCRDPIRGVKPIFIRDAVADDADPGYSLRPCDRMRKAGTMFSGELRRQSPGKKVVVGGDFTAPHGLGSWVDGWPGY